MTERSIIVVLEPGQSQIQTPPAIASMPAPETTMGGHIVHGLQPCESLFASTRAMLKDARTLRVVQAEAHIPTRRAIIDSLKQARSHEINRITRHNLRSNLHLTIKAILSAALRSDRDHAKQPVVMAHKLPNNGQVSDVLHIDKQITGTARAVQCPRVPIRLRDRRRLAPGKRRLDV